MGSCIAGIVSIHLINGMNCSHRGWRRLESLAVHSKGNLNNVPLQNFLVGLVAVVSTQQMKVADATGAVSRGSLDCRDVPLD